MKRLNFTLDNETVELLQELAETLYSGNKSQTVRAALESLAAHSRHKGWVVSGYTSVALKNTANCHSCGTTHKKGAVLYRPVFQRGSSADALPHMPSEEWYECSDCVK